MAVMADPDAIGPDGTVRLCCYLPQADTVWFLAGCGHVAPFGIRGVIRLRAVEATPRQLNGAILSLKKPTVAKFAGLRRYTNPPCR